MKMLAYFEKYPILKRELSALREQLAFLEEDPDAEDSLARRELLLRQIHAHQEEMEEIRQTLAHWAEEPCADRRARCRRSDEKLFLQCRFIQGMTVEKTAEAMCVSRDTAFRIRRRIASLELRPAGEKRAQAGQRTGAPGIHCA